MRLAGTISRYSSRAISQLTSAATHQSLAERSLRWAYQAKVMNTLDAARRSAEAAIGDNCISIDPFSDLIVASSEQRLQLAAARNGGFRRDFGQRHQNESALVHARVRHAKPWGGDDRV